MMKTAVSLGRWLLVVSIISLTACSAFSKKTGNEPMELTDFNETVALKEVWSRGVGDGQGKAYTNLSPAIEKDKIYAVDHLGFLVAINLESGKKLWSKKVNQQKLGLWGWIKSFFESADRNYQIVGGIGAENGLLMVSTYAGEVLALNEETGDEIWRRQLPGEILTAPRNNGSVVIVQTVNDKLYALDQKTGEQRWFYENPAPVLTLRGTAAPLVTGSVVYAGFSSGRLMAFNPTNGLILWEQRIALPKGRSELERMVDIHTTPVIFNGILYVGTYQGRISALSRGTGSPVWSKDMSTSQDLALAGDKLFVSDSDGKLVAMSSTSGEVLWTNEKLLRRKLNSPQVFGDYVAVVDFEGYMHVMNQADGEIVARERVDRKGARAPMLTSGDTLYVFTNSGDLQAYTAKLKK